MLKLSIITPSFNQGKFIKDTIESILCQDYSNYEHIVVDGCSKDETLEILRSYTHIKWISEKDNGAAEAINKGFKLADGDIITWINSDDYYQKNIFGKLMNIFQSHSNIDFIYGNRTVVIPDKKKELPEKTLKQSAERLIHYSADIVRQPCSFYRKSLLEKVGYLNESLKLVFDYELFIRIFNQTEPYYIDENYAFQRDYGSTLTRSNMRKQAMEIFSISRKYGAKLTDPIMYNSVLKKILFPGSY